MNRTILMGRLTRDPELRSTTSGTSVSSFSLAVNRAFSKEKEVDFIDIVCWKKTAEFVSSYFYKGLQVAVEGRLQTRTYTDKDGQNRKAFEVVADNVYFAEGKRDRAEDEKPWAESTPDITADDDLPF